ncbi:hypothetical protein BT63DRAFT_477915 [Microthyrium microscopicum]|uniref:SnoaL-like domain-containing protein n=1 Tax=Microthyrium microscopicum TaxID=703497 RepID=A0A6A6UI08_9PEZI|nr:hypothetical protein BT63DRAFT_477915 [Microthyrium microscopicum]
MLFRPILAIAASFITLTSAWYCGSDNQGDIDQDARTQLFKAFQLELFSGDVSDAFAKYVSTDLIEHTSSANSFGSDVGFLSALFPTVDISTVGNDLTGCFRRDDGAPICTSHYKATPKAGVQGFIQNVTAISDYYRYDGTCIVEHWDSTMTASATTSNPAFPG